MSNLTEQLLDRVAELDARSSSPEVLAATRAVVLDILGVIARGSLTDSAASSRRAMMALGAMDSGPSVVVGAGTRTGPATAAFVNAVAGHSIEFDDTHQGASSHLGVVIVPTALAVAEKVGANEETFITAVLRGYETMGRLGRALNPSEHYARHLHPTATTGGPGAAVAAATILGLDPAQVRSAVGIAATSAGGSMQFLEDGAWTKRLHPAVAARAGIEAAFLAADGYVGTRDGIGGRRGFLAAGSGRPVLSALTEDARPAVLDTSIKAHACCRYCQGPVDAVLDAKATGGVAADDVRRITIGLPSTGLGIVGSPIKSKRNPISVVDAQFSMPFAAAVAMLRGRAGLDEYSDEVLRDSDVTDFMRRIECVADPEIDRHFPEEWRSWAEIELSDGRSFRADVRFPKGDPSNPFGPEELRDKFMVLAGPVLGAAADRIVAAIELLPAAGALAELSSALEG
jgi:2-methylcitrate dehydratase PrpD